MSPRLAPALGLAAACAMLTGVGVIAISTGEGTRQPTEIAGAVLNPSGATTLSPSLAARQVKTNRATRTNKTPVPRATSSSPSSSPNPTGGDLAGSVSVPTTTPTHSSLTGPSSSAAVVSPALRMPSGVTNNDYAQAVFEAINRGRAAHHLASLTWSGNLQLSAHRHNQAMAASNTLSHQVSGEPSLGARETSASVQWTYAAENIGWTTDRTAQGALDIEARMYAETAPNDAHKKNILSTSATSVGVDVYLDTAHGRLWLTEDFSG